MFGRSKEKTLKKLEKAYRQLLEKARDVQRAGDIKQYAEVMAQSEQVWAQVERLRSK